MVQYTTGDQKVLILFSKFMWKNEKKSKIECLKSGSHYAVRMRFECFDTGTSYFYEDEELRIDRVKTKTLRKLKFRILMNPLSPCPLVSPFYHTTPPLNCGRLLWTAPDITKLLHFTRCLYYIFCFVTFKSNVLNLHSTEKLYLKIVQNIDQIFVNYSPFQYNIKKKQQYSLI